jgi:hypothetical protein
VLNEAVFTCDFVHILSYREVSDQTIPLLVASGSGGKNYFLNIFNITPMGKKLISKNHLTPALTSFSFEVSLKNKKKSGNDFR